VSCFWAAMSGFRPWGYAGRPDAARPYHEAVPSVSGGDEMAWGGSPKRARLGCTGNAASGGSWRGSDGLASGWVGGGAGAGSHHSVAASGGFGRDEGTGDLHHSPRKRVRLLPAEGDADSSDHDRARNSGMEVDPGAAAPSDAVCLHTAGPALATIMPTRRMVPTGERVMCEWLADGQLSVSHRDRTFILSEARLRELLELARTNFAGELTPRFFGATADQLISQLDAMGGARSLAMAAASQAESQMDTAALTAAPPTPMRAPDPVGSTNQERALSSLAVMVAPPTEMRAPDPVDSTNQERALSSFHQLPGQVLGGAGSKRGREVLEEPFAGSGQPSIKRYRAF